MTRLESAKRLESLGWALIRYARRIIRCCERPSYEHELAAVTWEQTAKARMREFGEARRDYMEPKK